jgi:anti-sigma B factor antagonist
MGSDGVAQPFELATKQRGHTTFVTLHGEFDLAGKDQFQEELARSLGRDGMRRVVLDLRGLTFIDSSGLREILDLWKCSQRDGFDLTIVRGGSRIAQIFKLVGFDDALPMVDDDSPLPRPPSSA